MLDGEKENAVAEIEILIDNAKAEIMSTYENEGEIDILREAERYFDESQAPSLAEQLYEMALEHGEALRVAEQASVGVRGERREIEQTPFPRNSLRNMRTITEISEASLFLTARAMR